MNKPVTLTLTAIGSRPWTGGSNPSSAARRQPASGLPAACSGRTAGSACRPRRRHPDGSRTTASPARREPHDHRRPQPPRGAAPDHRGGLRARRRPLRRARRYRAGRRRVAGVRHGGHGRGHRRGASAICPRGAGCWVRSSTTRVPIRLAELADDPRSVGLPPQPPADVVVPRRADQGARRGLRQPVPDRVDPRPSSAPTTRRSCCRSPPPPASRSRTPRLFEQAERRQRWLQASIEITTQLLSTDGDEPLDLIAQQTREIADADIVTVVLPRPDSDRLMVEVVASRQPVELAGYQFAAENTLSGQALATGRPVMLDDAAHQNEISMHLANVDRGRAGHGHSAVRPATVSAARSSSAARWAAGSSTPRTSR